MLSESAPVPSACPVPGRMHVYHRYEYCYFVVVQWLNHVQLFAVTWTAAHQVFIPFTVSWSLLTPVSIESVIPSNHLALCRPFRLLPSVFPSIRLLSVVLFALMSFWKLSVKQGLLQSTVGYLGVTSEDEYVLKSHHVPKAFLIREGPF